MERLIVLLPSASSLLSFPLPHRGLRFRQAFDSDTFRTPLTIFSRVSRVIIN